MTTLPLQTARLRLAMKTVAFLATVVLATCAFASDVTGVYVNHGSDFAEKLELTQTKNGPVKASFVAVRVKPDGNLSSDETSTTGTVPREGLVVLNGNATLARFFAGTISGEIKGDAIGFQVVDDRGSVSTATFGPSTAMLFQDYVNQLKCKSRSMLINAKLTENRKHLRQMIQSSKEWIAGAQQQASRIPDAQAAYIRIEDKMRLAMLKHSNDRAELLAAVNQAEAEGPQLDQSLTHQWTDLMKSGDALYKEFTSFDGQCGDNDAFLARRKQGANDDISLDWKCACLDATAESNRFLEAYKSIKKQSEDLKDVQSVEQANRKALIAEAKHAGNVEGQ